MKSENEQANELLRLEIATARDYEIALLRSELEEARKDQKDLQSICDEVSKVYYHITGGKLSKPHYKSDVIISHYDDEISRLNDRAERAEQQLKAALKAKWLACPSPNAILVADDDRDAESISYFNPCHKHMVLVRAEYDKRLVEANQTIADQAKQIDEMREVVEVSKELKYFFGLPIQAQRERIEWIEAALTKLSTIKEARS